MVNRGDIVFFSSTCSFVIEEEVIDKMSKYIQTRPNDPESGGILTGKVFKDRIVVTDCSVPSKRDKQSRYNFIRSKEGAQSFIDAKFKKSWGIEVYLGEWHTHPEDYPRPSKTDIDDFDRSMKVSVVNSQDLLMIIFGLKGLYIRSYHKQKLLNDLSLCYNTTYIK